jgi:hypothetical protein
MYVANLMPYSQLYVYDNKKAPEIYILYFTLLTLLTTGTVHLIGWVGICYFWERIQGSESEAKISRIRNADEKHTGAKQNDRYKPLGRHP